MVVVSGTATGNISVSIERPQGMGSLGTEQPEQTHSRRCCWWWLSE